MKASDISKFGNKPKTIFEEITDFAPKKNKMDMLESRASHVIQAAIHLLETIEKHCDVDDAEYLEKKLFNSIKSRDPEKFSRMIKKIKDE